MNNINIIENNSTLIIKKQIDFYRASLKPGQFKCIIITDQKQIKNNIQVNDDIIIFEKPFKLPNVPLLYVCGIGGRETINLAKLITSTFFVTYKKPKARLTLVPYGFGGYNETNNILILRKDPYHYITTTEELNSDRITRDIILEAKIAIDNIYTELMVLLINAIDIILVSKKMCASDVVLAHELYNTTVSIFNLIDYNKLSDTVFIPILQRLSLLHSYITEVIGYSSINAMAYPLINRGIAYEQALILVGYAFINHLLDNEFMPKIKNTVKAFEQKVTLGPIKYDDTLLDPETMLIEVLQYYKYSLENSNIILTNEQIKQIYTNIVGEISHEPIVIQT